ncbi:MAG: hypothetical protein KAI66_02705 [Lentisphaeria bacterium]|nr:hypothetical protein [Lentisphaeria bacterium]
MDEPSHRQEELGRVRSLRRRELSAVQNASEEEAWQELARRQAEMLSRLDEAIGVIAARRTELGEREQQFSTRLQTIQKLAVDAEELPDSPRMRELGREVHDAHIELVIHGRDGGGGDGGQELLPLHSLDFGELVRVGAALGLPLAVAMLLSALIIAISVAIVFGG